MRWSSNRPGYASDPRPRNLFVVSCDKCLNTVSNPNLKIKGRIRIRCEHPDLKFTKIEHFLKYLLTNFPVVYLYLNHIDLIIDFLKLQ